MCVAAGVWLRLGVLAPLNPLLPWSLCARHFAGHPAWRDGGTVGRVGRGSGRLRSAASRGVVRPMREVGSPKSAATRMRDEPYSYFLAMSLASSVPFFGLSALCVVLTVLWLAVMCGRLLSCLTSSDLPRRLGGLVGV